MTSQRTLSIILIAVIATSLQAQRDFSYIKKGTNQAALDQLASELKKEETRQLQKALQLARSNGWSTINLVGVDKRGNPIYHSPTNSTASTLVGNPFARSLFNSNGSGLTVGMWEAIDPVGNSWRPRNTHQDFGNRISIIDANGTGFGSHATHVAGTLIGSPPSGVSGDSRGMAPSANLNAYSSVGHTSEMATAAGGNNPLLISNHSYGRISGYEFDGVANTGSPFFVNFNQWTWHGPSWEYNANGDDPTFGEYEGTGRSIDQICYNAPYYLPCFAAANDDNDNPQTGTFADDEVRIAVGSVYVNYDPTMHPAGDGDQASSIPAYANATNILTVGNMTKSLGINVSSSRGPTDEGRIKPDICGIGTDLYSADNNANDDYASKTGTSMATPNVAGTLLILQDGFEGLNGNDGKYMKSATLKGLAIHTATDYGNTGPDYTYGWGLFNAISATNIIQQDAWVGGTSNAMMIEDTIVTSSDIFSFDFKAEGTEDVRITLCYTDPVLGGSATSLQNDLDLRLVDQVNGNTFMPYVLTPLTPTATAITGDNDIDNVEQIYLENSNVVAGRKYKIEVKVEGSLFQNDIQPFSVIVSGIQPSCYAEIRHKYVHLDSGTYAAEEDIVSQAGIDAGKNVTYQANGKIVLKAGFHAKTNSRFETAKAGCN